MRPNRFILSQVYGAEWGEGHKNFQDPQMCPEYFSTVFSMNIVSRVYSLIAPTKAGRTGGTDSGFVQRLKGAVAITFVKAKGLHN